MKFFVAVFLASITAASAQLNCGPAGSFTIAGSSTVEPIAKAWADAYKVNCPDTTITVEGGGSSVGAGRVCARPASGTPVEIGNMSREWRSSEANVTDKAQEKYKCVFGDSTRTVTQMDVAIDGISVVVLSGGLAGQCLRKLTGAGLSIDQLRWIYTNYTTAQLVASGWSLSTNIPFDDNNETSHKWSEIDPQCPNGEIKLSSPGTLSGTFDFFRESVFQNFTTNEGIATKRPFGILLSEDDKALVSFVSSSSEFVFGDGISYFGFAFYIQEGQILYGIPIRAKGATAHVAPTSETVEDGTYVPFSRRIYMNLLDSALAQTGPFLSFGLNQKGINLVKKVGYVPPPAGELAAILARIGREAPLPNVPTAAPVLPPNLIVPTGPTAPVPVPVPVPAGTPTPPPVPVNPPVAPTRKPCGLLGLSIFCPFTLCGVFGRLLGLCSN